jgi:hypothetical protein
MINPRRGVTMSAQIPILLIGFNRLQHLSARLEELVNSKLRIPLVFIVIDGPRVDNNFDLTAIANIDKLVKQYEKILPINYKIRDTNFGVFKNIEQSISDLFENFEFLIIVEDDVSISPDFYGSMCSAIKEFLNKENIYVIGSFSIFKKNNSLILKNLIPKNRWRVTSYFFTWGIATSREFWNLYRNENLNYSNSKNWNNLSNRKKRIWLRRFASDNWDYKAQRTLFLNDGFSLVPLYRFSANEGMGDPLSTHTRFPKPWYIFGQGYSGGIPTGKMQNNKFWKFIDSNTLAGDGLFSTRARSAGIRTILKKFFSLQIKK